MGPAVTATGSDTGGSTTVANATDSLDSSTSGNEPTTATADSTTGEAEQPVEYTGHLLTSSFRFRPCGQEQEWILEGNLPQQADHCDEFQPRFGNEIVSVRVLGVERPPVPPLDLPRLDVLQLLEGPCGVGCPTDGELEGCRGWESHCTGMTDHDCTPTWNDCPFGDKCMPWSASGDETWNDTRCSPIDDDPGRPGDSCIVEGSGHSGLDSCDRDTMCWDIDPATMAGTCVEMCTWTEDGPVCTQPGTSCFVGYDQTVQLCLPLCTPLAPDCPEGQGCFPNGLHYFCLPEELEGW